MAIVLDNENAVVPLTRGFLNSMLAEEHILIVLFAYQLQSGLNE
jgi:hypothetical protein